MVALVIVNNFLNNLMLFEMPAQDDASHGSLNTIEELIQPARVNDFETLRNGD